MGCDQLLDTRQLLGREGRRRRVVSAMAIVGHGIGRGGRDGKVNVGGFGRPKGWKIVEDLWKGDRVGRSAQVVGDLVGTVHKTTYV